METPKGCSGGAIAITFFLWDESAGGAYDDGDRGFSCHDLDVNMSAEAEGARLLAGVEEEGLDEVSFFAEQKGFVLQFFSTFIQHGVVTVFSRWVEGGDD